MKERDVKELEKYVEKRMILVQTSFDITKSTFLTAGIIVAVSMDIPGLSEVTILGFSSVKIILSFAVASAISLVLSFVFAEHQVKRHDLLISGVTATKIEKFFLRKNAEKRANQIAWFYGLFHNKLVTYSNNLSTLCLLIALGLFLYCLIAI